MKFNFAIFSIIVCYLTVKIRCDDFPSLLMANATIAILLDREYLDTQYEDTLNEVKIIIERVLREDLKNGGLYVNYYSWTMINFKKDFTAVLSVANCKDTWKVFMEARRENLLLMALTDTDCPRLPPKEAIMIPIMRPGEELPQVIFDMKAAVSFKWKTSVLLHDDTFDRDMISRCAIALSSESPDGYVKPVTLSLFKLRAHIHEWERRKALRKTLANLPTRFIGTNFLVVVTSTSLENVMETAKDLGLVHTFSQWLYVISDTNYEKYNISSVAALIGEGENVAFAYNFTRFDNKCVSGVKCHLAEVLRGFVLGLSKMIREEQAIYGQISDEEWEAIRPTKREKRDNILASVKLYLVETAVCGNCTTWTMVGGEVWGNVYDTKFTSFNIADDWDTSEANKKTKRLMKVGTWKPVNGYQSTDALFPHIAHGFRNKQLHIVTTHNPPWQIITYNESGIPSNFRGLTIDILNELSKKLNFTYMLHVASVNYNLLNETENFINSNVSISDIHLPTINIPTEIINIVGSNKVLLAAVGSTVNERYKTILNFSNPISIQPYSFIVSRPKELSRIYLFLSPFAWDVWLCIAFSIAFMSPLLYVVNRMSPYYDYFRVRQHGGLNTMNNCFWYIYGALLQQGGLHLPLADSGRLIIGTWWLVVIIIVTSYCGNLVAYLTFPKIEIPITTVNQLLKHQDSVTWGIKAGTYFEQYLKETDFPKHQRLYERAIFHQYENPEIIDSVRRGKHIYFDWKSNLQYILKKEFLENDRCDFALATEDLLDEQISILLPRYSPYLALINEEIKRMHQMGFIERWMKEYLPKKDRCWNYKITSEITNHTVNIDDMQGCFLVLIFGVAGSIFIILIEFLWKRHTNSRMKSVVKPFVE